MSDLSLIYKLIILYMLRQAEKPLKNSQIADFILEKEYMNYFQLQQTFAELTDSELIISHVEKNSTLYSLNKKGLQTLSYFDNEISTGIKEDVKRFLHRIDAQKAVTVRSDYYKTLQDQYSVRCQILEKGVERMGLSLVLPNESAAQAVQKNWEKKAQDIYAIMMEELL